MKLSAKLAARAFSWCRILRVVLKSEKERKRAKELKREKKSEKQLKTVKRSRNK